MSSFEYVALNATLMCLVALSIDLVLPALGMMAQDLKITSDNHRQLVITALFVGLAIGQLGYGPLSDSYGRKPAIIFGSVVFCVGCLVAATATTLEGMLVGRVVQGLGAAGPRIVAVAMIRDRYQGAEMARIMSLIMGVFIFVPMFAPALGQLLLVVMPWRALFLVTLAIGIVGVLWLTIRQAETLVDPVPFNVTRLVASAREFFRSRVSVWFTIAGAFAYGALMGFVNSSQQIFQDLYGAGSSYAVLFGGTAACTAVSVFANSVLVQRVAPELICKRAVQFQLAVAIVFVAATVAVSGQLPLYVAYGFICLTLLSLGLTFGNFAAIALKPLGHIAGTAAALNATLSTALSLTVAAAIGQAFDGTVTPLAIGFCICGFASLIAMARAKVLPTNG